IPPEDLQSIIKPGFSIFQLWNDRLLELTLQLFVRRKIGRRCLGRGFAICLCRGIVRAGCDGMQPCAAKDEQGESRSHAWWNKHVCFCCPSESSQVSLPWEAYVSPPIFRPTQYSENSPSN